MRENVSIFFIMVLRLNKAVPLNTILSSSLWNISILPSVYQQSKAFARKSASKSYQPLLRCLWTFLVPKNMLTRIRYALILKALFLMGRGKICDIDHRNYTN